MKTYPWIEVGTISLDDGSPGGDKQIGPASSRRFQLAVEDGTFAVVTVYSYATREERNVDEEGNPTDEPVPYLDVEEQTEFIICTDPDDPGGTEIWSEYEYDYPMYLAPKDEEELLARAVANTNRYGVEHFNHWNGIITR